MRAYQLIEDADLDRMREEELKMKGHRRVFDGVTAKYIMKAELQVTAAQKTHALRTERRRLLRLKKVLRQTRN
jgi:hypothetical protein